MSGNKLSRRDFGRFCLGLTTAVAAGAGYLAFDSEQNGHDPVSIFLDLALKIESADEAAARFVRADSAFLMASYAVFFPEMMRRLGFGAVSALQVAAEKQKFVYSKDHHRLDALPAVAAAHLLPVDNGEATQRALSKIIVASLKNPHRETQEIVIQNLVTAVAPNFDSIRFASFERSLIAQIKRIIGEANENEKQTMAAVHCVEFLLNAKALLVARNASPKELVPYDNAIKLALRVKAKHLQFLPGLIRLHNATFKASPSDIESLPPQSSEALMGWKKSPRAREYLSALAFSRARMLYTIYNTASGRLTSNSSMTMENAKRALPKLVGFIKAFDIELLLQGSPFVDKVSSGEPQFSKFLKSALPEILRSPEQFGMSIEDVQLDPKVVELRDSVPFSKFEDRGLLTRAFQDQQARSKKGVVQAGLAGLTVVGTAAAIPPAIQLLTGREMPASVPSDVVKEAMTEFEKREAALQAGVYKGLDEQQENLGDIDLLQLSLDLERNDGGEK